MQSVVQRAFLSIFPWSSKDPWFEVEDQPKDWFVRVEEEGMFCGTPFACCLPMLRLPAAIGAFASHPTWTPAAFSGRVPVWM